MKYSEHYEVRSYEVDLDGFIKPEYVMKYMQETADHQMRDEDIPYTELYQKHHKSFVVSRMSIEMLAPCGEYADVESRTWIIPGKGAIFQRAYELVNGDEVFAKAMCNWGLINTETGKLILQRDYDMSGYSKDEPLDLLIPTRFRVPEEITFSEVLRLKVSRSMCDINKHMNNTVYAAKIYDIFPNLDEYFMTSLNIRYIHEAPFESELVMYVSDFIEDKSLDPRADGIVYIYSEADGNQNIDAVVGIKRK